jgi:glycerol uptake facilitator-like aquaporin
VQSSTNSRLLAEFLGSALLVAAVVGSGFMAAKLTDDLGLQLWINTFATITMLLVIISIFAPISGAHFNPIVTLLARYRLEISNLDSILFILVQISGAIFGTAISNLMFGSEIFSISQNIRLDGGSIIGEIVATTGLLIVIVLGAKQSKYLVPAWIGSAYFFTASTSFANPAVTIGRIFTDAFPGIAPSSVMGFIAAQLISLPIALVILGTLAGKVK